MQCKNTPLNIKARNDCIRSQAAHFAELEREHHQLSERSVRAIKCLYIHILRKGR